MNDPFTLIPWAIAIGIAWVILTSLTGLDDFLKRLVGRKETTTALAAKIETLERRIAQLEAKNSGAFSGK